MNDQAPDPAMGTRRRTTTTTTSSDENAVDLLGKLTRQGAHLAQEQVSLMQAEVREAANDVKAAVGALAGAAVVGIAGLVVLLMGLGFLLGDAIQSTSWGTTIVGVVALIVAAIMYSAGKKKASATNLKPERTIRTVEDDPAAATGRMNTAGGRNDR